MYRDYKIFKNWILCLLFCLDLTVHIELISNVTCKTKCTVNVQIVNTPIEDV